MKHYLQYFAAVYSIALVITIGVLMILFNFNGITLFPTLIVSAFISARHFVKREHRLPLNEEKFQLVWSSSAVAIVIGSFFIFFLVLINPNAEAILKSADQAGIGISALIMLCLVAIHGAIFYIAYGWYVKFCLKEIS